MHRRQNKPNTVKESMMVLLMCLLLILGLSQCSGKEKTITIEIDGQMQEVEVTDFKTYSKRDKIYFCLDGECMHYNGPYIIKK